MVSCCQPGFLSPGGSSGVKPLWGLSLTPSARVSQGWGPCYQHEPIPVASSPHSPSVSTALAGQGALARGKLLLWLHRDSPFGAAAEPRTLAACPTHWFCILPCFPCGRTHWQLSRAWLGWAQSLPSAAHLSRTPPLPLPLYPCGKLG